MFNMPPEFPTLIPTNAEATLVCTRALMIYEAYKFRGLKGPIPRLLIVGDINFDGVVHLEDISMLTRGYGAIVGDPEYSPKIDLNGDGVVDSTDLGILGAQWDRSSTLPPRKVTVPVPARETISRGVESFTSALATCAIIEILRKAYKAWKR